MDPANPPIKLQPSQRTAYQFPVYRWIGWLTVAGYSIGLLLMFFVAGMFGAPAPLAWAFLVTIFAFGILLLERPRWLLNFMLVYYLAMPDHRLLGLLWVPLPVCQTCKGN